MIIPKEYIEREQAELEIARKQAEKDGTQQDAMAFELQQQTTNLIREQLSLTEELEIIENLLRGKIQKTENGVTNWVDPPDKDMIILTEHGVHLIINTIQFYMNKNTLLSNYDEDTINHKMEDFATDLADTIFMEYEKVFAYPTFQDCRDKLNERIERKTELREYAYHLIGKKVDKEKKKRGFINEIEKNVEREIDKIREQVIKNKLKRFALIIREVQDAVHSTYLRAWNGQERRTLRQHIHVSETMGYNQPTPSGSKVNPVNWFKR